MITARSNNNDVIPAKAGIQKWISAFAGMTVKNKPFKVLVCLVTLMAFLFNIISYDLALLRPLGFVGQAWAVGSAAGLPGGSSDRAGGSGLFKELNVNTFTLPEYLGHVKDSWSPVLSNTQYPIHNTVIHIQDAHCNYYAQLKIAEIVEYLNKQYGIDTINLEGGAKDYDLSIFTGISDKAMRNKASDYFAKEGLVNGAEYFAINNPEKVSLWGVEDTKLYIDNLKVYRDSLKHKDEVNKHLNILTHILNNLKPKIYSKELLELDNKYSQYKAETLAFKDYLAYIIQIAKKKSIDIKSFKNIDLLSQSLAQEGAMDFKKANIQRDNLIDKLQKKLSKKSLEELVLKTVEFKTEKISQKGFYSYILDKAKQKDISLDDLPELVKYIAYVSMYGSIDKTKTMEELESLEGSIKESLFKNGEQRELDKLSKNLVLLKNIFNVTLTKDDYKYYKANEDSFNVANYIKFINSQSSSSLRGGAEGADEAISGLDYYGKIGTVPSSLSFPRKRESNGNWDCPIFPIESISSLDRYREEIVKFYAYSLKRDSVFLKNLKLSSPTGPVGKATILITGGFHGENLSELFKKNNISYISIMPEFKNNNGYECPYFKILSGEKRLNIREALPSIIKSALAIPDQLSPAMARAVAADTSFSKPMPLIVATKQIISPVPGAVSSQAAPAVLAELEKPMPPTSTVSFMGAVWLEWVFNWIRYGINRLIMKCVLGKTLQSQSRDKKQVVVSDEAPPKQKFWTSSNTRYPVELVKDGKWEFQNNNEINLNQLPVGSLVQWTAKAVQMPYIIKIEGNEEVTVWFGGDPSGVRGKIKTIATIFMIGEQKKQLIAKEDGILRNGYNVIMPYLSYNPITRKAYVKIEAGFEHWGDHIQDLKVLKVSPIQFSPAARIAGSEAVSSDQEVGARLAKIPSPAEIAPRTFHNNPAHISYLNRHREQWKWLRENAMADIVGRARQQALDHASPELRVMVFDPSTGEELARTFYEIVTWLTSHGENVAKNSESSGWRIHIDGIEKDAQVADKARRRIEGEETFAWWEGDHDGKREDALDYTSAVIGILNEYRTVLSASLFIHTEDITDIRLFLKFPKPHLVLSNKVFYQILNPRQVQVAMDQAWPETWFAGTEAFEEGSHHIKVRISPDFTYYIAKPRAPLAFDQQALLNALRLEIEDPGKGSLRYASNHAPLPLDYNLWIIAHGLTDNNIKNVFHGGQSKSKDSRLNVAGTEEAENGARSWWEKFGEDFLKHPDEYIFLSSPLERAEQTFEVYRDLIRQKSGIIIRASTDDGAIEIDFGLWNSKTLEEIRKEFGEEEYLKAVSYRSGNVLVHSSKGGESFLGMIRRVRDWLAGKNTVFKGKKVFLFGHGTFQKAAGINLRSQNVVFKDRLIDWRNFEYKRGQAMEMAVVRLSSDNKMQELGLIGVTAATLVLTAEGIAGFLSFIALACTALLFHEFAHKKVLNWYGVKGAKMKFMLWKTFLPVAGIEYDSDELTKLPSWKHKRALVVLAGPITNFILAGLLYGIGTFMGDSSIFGAILRFGALANFTMATAGSLVDYWRLFNIDKDMPMPPTTLTDAPSQAAPAAQSYIPKPHVGSTEGYVNEAILKADAQLNSGQITSQQAAEMITQAIITMPDSLEDIVNMPTAIAIYEKAFAETGDGRFKQILGVLRLYQASHEIDQILSEKIRNIWAQALPAPATQAASATVTYGSILDADKTGPMVEKIKELIPIDMIKEVAGDNISIEVYAPEETPLIVKGEFTANPSWTVVVRGTGVDKQIYALLSIHDRRRENDNSLVIERLLLREPGKEKPGMPPGVIMSIMSRLKDFASQYAYDKMLIEISLIDLAMGGYHLIELYKFGGFKISDDYRNYIDKEVAPVFEEAKGQGLEVADKAVADNWRVGKSQIITMELLLKSTPAAAVAQQEVQIKTDKVEEKDAFIENIIRVLKQDVPEERHEEGIADSSVILLLNKIAGKWHILLIKRAMNMEYPGMWAFPGGIQQKVDLSLKSTGVREFKEEMGASIQEDSIIGALQYEDTLDGKYRIFPFVAVIDGPVEFHPDRNEVGDEVWVPLDQAVDGEITINRGFEVSVLKITGATQRILKRFSMLLSTVNEDAGIATQAAIAPAQVTPPVIPPETVPAEPIVSTEPIPGPGPGMVTPPIEPATHSESGAQLAVGETALSGQQAGVRLAASSILEVIGQHFAGQESISFLDQETGTGEFVPNFTDLLKNRFRNVDGIGTDTLEAWVERAKQRGYRVVHANPQIGEDYAAIGVKNGIRDIVTINNIESAPIKQIKQAGSILKPNGMMIVTFEIHDIQQGSSIRETVTHTLESLGYRVENMELPRDYPRSGQFESHNKIIIAYKVNATGTVSKVGPDMSSQDSVQPPVMPSATAPSASAIVTEPIPGPGPGMVTSQAAPAQTPEQGSGPIAGHAGGPAASPSEEPASNTAMQSLPQPKQGTDLSEKIRPNVIIPDYVYMVLPSAYYPVVITLPTSKSEIPWEFVTNVESTKDNELVLVFKNSGFIKIHRVFSLESAIKIASKILTKQNNGLIKQIYNILNNSKELATFQEILFRAGAGNIYDYAEEKLDVNFDVERPELFHVIYKGTTYTPDELKIKAAELFKDEISAIQSFAFSGDYLYRAVTDSEWRDIQRKGYMTIRERDNFESTIGPQVRHFAQEEGYAGVIIRIPVLGPYFANAGFQVRRVTSAIPHFVVPEILVSKVEEPEAWVKLTEYFAELGSKPGQIELNNIISDLIPSAQGPAIDHTALVKAMKEKLNALIGEDRSKGPAVIRSILSAVSGLEQPVRSELQMALRTAIMVDGLGAIDKTEHVNIIAQIADVGESNRARKPIQDIKGKLERYPYNLYAQSILGEGINDESELKKFIDRIITSVRNPVNKEPRVLLLLPERLHKYYEQAKAYFKENGIDIDKPDALVRIQKIEQGANPDFVTQFGLGFEILEYVRQGEKAEPNQELLNLIAAMVDSDVDPRAILNELFKIVLKIRRIDWRTLDEERRAWEAVATAL